MDGVLIRPVRAGARGVLLLKSGSEILTIRSSPRNSIICSSPLCLVSVPSFIPMHLPSTPPFNTVRYRGLDLGMHPRLFR